MTSSIGRSPPPPRPATASTTTPAGAPTTPAATTPTAPAGWGPKVVSQATTAVTAQVATALKNAGPSDFDLVPGTYPDAVPLPQVLQAIGNTPAGQAAINKVLDGFKAKTGIDVPPDLRSAAMANPNALTNALEITPGQLSAGIMGLNAAYKAGKLPQAGEDAPFLPQTFDLGSIDSLNLPRPASNMKELAPGLFTGDLPSATSDDQVKRNRVVAEVFGRLANNASAADGQKFSVTYGGQSYTKLDDFLGALKADGYSVDVSFNTRVANFSDLKTAVPGSNPPKYLDVPAPLMIKTGVRDALGKEAVVPAGHSEMIISLHSGPNTKGPKLDTDTKFYQGISGTGFFPANVWQDPSWCGGVTTAKVSGDQALDAVKLAGTYTDLVNTTAKKLNLYADGYGVTGVCNDSVAVVEQAVTGTSTQYPLLMKDEVMMGGIKQHLTDSDKSDDASYVRLRDAIARLPSDTRVNATTRQRALASMPWAAGQEPFGSSQAARKILGG